MSFIREVRDTIHKGWCRVLQTSVKVLKRAYVGNEECSEYDADFINTVPGKTVLQSFQEEERS